MNIFKYISRRWNSTGGYLEFLKIALPLIISTGAWSIQSFINRFFLAWHSQDAFAACLPAGMLNFSIMSIFIGTLTYVDVFVSQYYGKKEYESIGPGVWQSFHLSFLGAFILLFISFFSENIFSFIGHAPEIMSEEIKYFRVLCYGAFPSLAASALSGFYAGRGKTKIVLYVSIIGILVNILFDYILIFGNFGFPELGIEGAAIASIIGSVAMITIFILLVTSKKNDKKYNTRNLKPDFDFIKRLLKFGFPNGVQFFFDMAGFTFFILVIGKIGMLELSATNIALNINLLAFMPLVGCGITTSILVGQYLGRNKASIAEICVQTSLHIVYAYVTVVILAFVFIPDVFIYPFSKGSESLIIEQVKPMAVNLLRFVALYSIFDPMNIIFSSAIKGAGDTAFVMKLLVISSIFVAAIPVYFIVVIFKLGLYAGWSVLVVYVLALAIPFYLRYKSGKWKRMRVIKMDIIDG
ncbi:MAG: MATE family efflux transporter [Endomicrobia bacterium]|nr:MATE family efflux transporter [Endomicrobiia bacterium]MCL2799599.1 MATE family efflux transporter [Endomicrobiia bacterium]